MHWKLKAKIQNVISLMPTALSYDIYYWIQRHFGGLRRANPLSRFIAGIEVWKRINRQGYSPIGKVFLEVGTGRAPLVPLAYWLMGAESIISIDLNPYLKEELIVEHLLYVSENEEKILNLFGPLIDMERFKRLLNFIKKSKFSATEFLDLCQINYIAPGNAANTNLPEQYIDFYTSYTVFEHIPLNTLIDILNEGNRIIKNNGLFVHYIDYSDHFSHSDKSISAINFLQYNDDEWARYAGNRYMYMNRLRHDDFLGLFEGAGHKIVDVEPEIDQCLEEILISGEFSLDERFSSKPKEVLTIHGAWVLTEKNG